MASWVNKNLPKQIRIEIMLSKSKLFEKNEYQMRMNTNNNKNNNKKRQKSLHYIYDMVWPMSMVWHR